MDGFSNTQNLYNYAFICHIGGYISQYIASIISIYNINSILLFSYIQNIIRIVLDLGSGSGSGLGLGGRKKVYSQVKNKGG